MPKNREVNIKFTADTKDATDKVAALTQAVNELTGRENKITFTVETAGAQQQADTLAKTISDITGKENKISITLDSPGAQVSELNTEIARTASLLRQLQESGAGTIIDADGNTRSVDELARALARLKAEQEKLAQSDSISQRAEESKTAATETAAAVEKATAKEIVAYTKAEEAAEKKLRKITEANELAAASADQLAEKLALLNDELKEAHESGDVVAEAAIAEEIKRTTAELDRKQKAYDRADASAQKAALKEQTEARRTAAAHRQAGENFTRSVAGMARAAATGTLSVRTLATGIRGIGAAIKTGLGPIGWGILLLEGLIFAAQKAWDALKSFWTENQVNAEESIRKTAENIDVYVDKLEKVQKAGEEALLQGVQDSLLTSYRARTAELDKQIAREARILAIISQQAAFRENLESLRHKQKLADLEAEYEGREKDEDYYSRRNKLEDEHRQTSRDIEDEEDAQRIKAKEAELNAAALKYSALAAKVKTYRNLRSDRERAGDWAAEARALGIYGSREKIEFEAAQGDEAAQEALAVLERNTAEEDSIAKLGDWRLLAEYNDQRASGRSTFNSLIAPVLEHIIAEQEQLAPLSREMEEELRRLKTARDNRITLRTEEDILTHKTRRNAGQSRARQRAQKKQKDDAEAKGKAEEYAEKKAKDKQDADARAEETRYAYKDATQDYRGRGRKLLDIFSDGRLDKNEMGTYVKLLQLADSNKKLRDILNTLLDVAEQNADNDTARIHQLHDLKLDLNSQEKRAERLRRRARGH